MGEFYDFLHCGIFIALFIEQLPCCIYNLSAGVAGIFLGHVCTSPCVGLFLFYNLTQFCGIRNAA